MENKRFLELHEEINNNVKGLLFYDSNLDHKFQSSLTNSFSGVAGVEGVIEVLTKIYGYVKSKYDIDLITHS